MRVALTHSGQLDRPAAAHRGLPPTTPSSATPALLATIKDLFNARIVIDALLGRMADAQEIDDATRTGPGGSAQVAQALWEQFDPAQQEALIQRLALLIAKAAVAAPHAEEHGDE